jgi:hypothetical protein
VDAAPVIARGHNLAVFVPPVPAAATPCLQAIPENRPTLILTADSDRAVALAESCPRPGAFAVSGLARAERKLKATMPTLLFVAAADALQLLKRSQLRCAELQTVVLAWPEQLDEEGREALGAVMAETPRDSQRMILTAAAGPGLDELLERYAFKAVTFGFPAADAPHPASLGPASYVLARPSQLEAVRRRILDALDPESDETVTVAPCPASRGEAEALRGLPADAPGTSRAIFVVEPVQLAWLRSLFTPLTALRLPTSLAALEHRAEAVRARLARTLESENLDRELFLIGPLLEQFDAAEVAAAALRLAGTEAIAQAAEPAGGRASLEAGAAGGAVPSWTKLWIGVGRKDNVGPGDLLGAIVGETGIPADHIGKIEVRELFCLAEVRPADAEAVLKALGGTTLRGRRITARLDRGQGQHRPSPRRGGPPGRSGPPPQGQA